MALTAIYQAIPEDVLLMLAEKDTAKEAWETLKTMHMGADRVKEAKVQTLRNDFEVIRMKDSESVDDFAMRLNTIVTGIRSLGEKIEEITVVKKFLRVVPIRFMQIVTSIEQFGDLKNMTVEEVVGRLKTHEERLRGNRGRGRTFLIAHTCRVGITTQENQRNKLVKYVKGKRRICRVESEVWYLDNGASNYMIGDRSKFRELEEKVTGHVRFGDGSTVAILGKGSILFDSKNGDQMLLNELYKTLLRTGRQTCLLATKDEPAWIWHSRLGHVNFLALKKLSDKNMSMIEKSSGYEIKTLRTDRGGEFTSKDFTTFCEENGVRRHLTTPYSPQQNGVVERRNRTIMDMGRSLLKGRNVPGEFWGEAVRDAVYLLNRLATKALPDITPYEAWFCKKPNLEHLKVFGCVVFSKTVGGHLKKLDDRSKKMVYFGVEDGTKGNRLFDSQDRKLRISRDVVFDEKEGWNWYKNEDEEKATPKTFTIIEPQSQIQLETPQNIPEINTDQPNNPLFESVQPETALYTPVSAQPSPTSNQTESLSSELRPRGFRSLADIYEEAEPVILEPGELLMIAADQPLNYKEAVTYKEWRDAMQTELDVIEKNKTWQLVDLPPGHKAIGLKWVFKVKKYKLGKVVKHKARLVAKGFVQKQGIDFDEVFAPVAWLNTVRLILALAAQHGWVVHHLDVKSAFLNGDLKEEVYVLKLSKALYGLRQAPRAWNIRLDKSLKGLDIIEFKEQMKKEFEMSDLGLLSYYLGIEVSQKRRGISLRQTAYARKILEQFGLLDCNPTKSPMEPKLKITKDEDGEEVDPTEYRRVVGCLRYLTHTRPDLSFSVGIASREVEDLVGFNDSDHGGDKVGGKSTGRMIFYLGRNAISWQSLKQKTVALSSCEAEFMATTATACQAIWLGNLVNELIGQNMMSITLYVDNKSAIALMKNPVFHGRSKHSGTFSHLRQNTILEESGRSLAIFGEVHKIGKRRLHRCGHGSCPLDTSRVQVLVCMLSRIGVEGFASKWNEDLVVIHSPIRLHYGYCDTECVERGQIIVKHVDSKDQRADILTKTLAYVKHSEMRNLIGVTNLEPSFAWLHESTYLTYHIEDKVLSEAEENVRPNREGRGSLVKFRGT
ncbi:hypothetical protein LXL04_017266 [Taraxacum kok-saghyz]